MAGAIRVKTMALFAAERRTLVMVCFDKFKQEHFHRLLGGHVEFGETSEEALKREMREELGTEVEVLSLLQVMQNRFSFEGRPHHEVVFIHHVRFLDETFNRRKDLYNLEPHLDEPFIWIPLAEATGGRSPSIRRRTIRDCSRRWAANAFHCGSAPSPGRLTARERHCVLAATEFGLWPVDLRHGRRVDGLDRRRADAWGLARPDGLVRQDRLHRPNLLQSQPVAAIELHQIIRLAPAVADIIAGRPAPAPVAHDRCNGPAGLRILGKGRRRKHANREGAQ